MPSLNQFDQLAGGVAEGMVQGTDRRVKNEENTRKRTLFEANETFKALAASRPVFGADQAAGAPQGLPTGQSGTPAAGGSSPLPAAGGTGQPKPKFRDSYQNWYKQVSSAAMRAGGIDGLSAFQDREMEVNRRQTLDLTTKAYTAMGDGAASTAADLLNKAMEAQPVDANLKWEARDGKLFANRNGNLQEYSQTQLFEMQRRTLQTTETYAAFLDSLEKERAAKEDEKVARQKADAGDISAAAQAVNALTGSREEDRKVAGEESRLAQEGAETEAIPVRADAARRTADAAGVRAQTGVDTEARELQAAPGKRSETAARSYHLLRTADAAGTTAQARLTAAQKKNGWTAGNALTINKNIQDLELAGKLITDDWSDAVTKNPGIILTLKGGITDVIMDNDFDKANYAGATKLVQTAFSLMGGVQLRPGSPIPKVAQNAAGQWVAQFEGEEYVVNEAIAAQIMAVRDHESSKGK